MNSVKLYGRLTKGPTIKTGDTTKAYITLAVTRTWKNKETGEYEADFPNIVFYKSTDYIQKYCRKGSRAIIEGRIRTFLTNENGQNIKNMQIVGSNITLIDYPQKDDDDPDMVPIPEDMPENDYRGLLPEGFPEDENF